MLTPFDSLGGFERRIEGDSVAREASIAQVGDQVRAIKASRRTSKLVDASDLPKPQRTARKIHEGFWRSGTKKLAAAKSRPGDDNIANGSTFHRTNTLKEYGATHQTTGGSPDDKVDASGRLDDLDDEAFERRRVAARFDSEAGNDPDGFDDVIFQGGYRIPSYIYEKLFDYQRTGIKWLWELHTQRAGGIMGDEMGLGKTIQVTAFLAGLHHSGLFKPTIIICPATMLKQWLRELREWYPLFRVAILHESARAGNGAYSRSDVIKRIASSPSGVLITTYDHMRICKKQLLSVRWGYAILDEGHKIRNPDAEVTLAAKQLPTVHRLIMSGSPIQNRLVELWSLFDFVFPGKLGTLPVFQAQFAIPIQQGGYANASSLQVATAYKCAVVLRDMVSPYLLRRRKSDVAKSLPKKTERVLFCSLTSAQREMYMAYLASKELSEILNGDKGALVGIDILRKICNHPDLLERSKGASLSDYGNPERSGKMLVLDKVLEHWISEKQKYVQNHTKSYNSPNYIAIHFTSFPICRALVFSQTQQTLDILEKMIQARGWTYHRMDGNTSIALRSKLIDDFNMNEDVSIFLLTTRVGGLGINLVGASKCIIFDPDWNPSTDVQARERAWRIGQTQEVTIYRLIISGTIEEKVYHRQVYKQFLTDRVLRDPRQKRFFKAKDLSDLFTLGDEYAEGTETAAIFSSLGTGVTQFHEPERVTNGISPDATQAGAVNDDTQAASSKTFRDPTSAPNSFTDREEEITESEKYPTTGDGQGDARILQDLFDGSGICSALDHDKIEDAHNPENRVAQKEAQKVAERAAKALKQSRAFVSSNPVNAPTWTGRSGLAGAPGIPKFGRVQNSALGGGGSAFKSSNILAKIRARNAEATSLAVQSPEVSRAKSLADRIIAYLDSRGGSASSASVASTFRDSEASGDPELFKSVLKQVATLRRGQGGRAWLLKREFRSDSRSADR